MIEIGCGQCPLNQTCGLKDQMGYVFREGESVDLQPRLASVARLANSFNRSQNSPGLALQNIRIESSLNPPFLVVTCFTSKGRRMSSSYYSDRS
ncbi:hypothetical protein GF362_05475 [Candidatus Dojkabacteria bacterium]|nr:hypothetical protein [Candidatus Dojkabacteria bacterium]